MAGSFASAKDLRFALEFLDVGRSDDGAGGFVRADSVQITVQGGIRPATAREIETASRREQRLTHIGVIRWRPDFMPEQGQTVRWRDRRNTTRTAYVMSARDPREEGRFVELGLREGGPL